MIRKLLVGAALLAWLVGIHVIFVLSAVMLALTDRISGDH